MVGKGIDVAVEVLVGGCSDERNLKKGGLALIVQDFDVRTLPQGLEPFRIFVFGFGL